MASDRPISLVDPAWLVGSFSARQSIAALWIGSIGLLILGLQPILLGAMFTEGRVTLDELAVIATAEIVMIALGSAIAGSFFSTRRLATKSVLFLRRRLPA
jgi:MFS transporter, DHA1 family, inner membrane transport protein